MIFVPPDYRIMPLAMPAHSPFGDALLVSLPNLKTDSLYQSGSAALPGLTAAAVSPDGRWAALGTTSGTVRILSLEDLRHVAELAASAQGTVALAGDGRYTAVGSAPTIQSNLTLSNTAVSCLLPELLQRKCEP